MDFFDHITFDATRTLADGSLVASVRAARVGIQDYLGSEVGKPEMSVVKVYRPETEVFNKDTLKSFLSIPVTNDHPPEAVTTDNFTKYSRGHTGEEWARDGEFMRVSMMVRDADTIKAISNGKRQLSCGYSCDLKWEAGTTADGIKYDAVQTNIRGNHLAIVDFARGGPKLKIGDTKMTTRTILVDTHTVEVSEAAAIAFSVVDSKLKTVQAIADKVPALETTIGTHLATIATKDGEIAALRKEVADKTITPEMMDKAIAARSAVVDVAKRVVPTLDCKGKTESEIRKAVVSAKLGDAAATLTTDEGISGAFAVIAAADASADPVRQQFMAVDAGAGNVFNIADASARATAAHNAMVAGLNGTK